MVFHLLYKWWMLGAGTEDDGPDVTLSVDETFSGVWPLCSIVKRHVESLFDVTLD